MSQELAAKLGCTPQQALLASLLSQGFSKGDIATTLGESESALQELIRDTCKTLRARNSHHLSYIVGKVS